MTEGVKKSKGLPTGVAAEAHPVHAAAVLGAGVMGAESRSCSRIRESHPDEGSHRQALLAGVQQATRFFKAR